VAQTSVSDVERVARQLGRAPLPFERVVARCGDGWPVAVQQAAHTPAGAPFPTTFWLTCPGLVRAVGRLEDAGGVDALEQRIADEPEARASYDDARRRQRALRPDLGDLGIGGVRRAGQVKCLHAHAAFALGAPPYTLGAAILEAAGGVPDPCCMRSADA
jgi:hypothetical protein